jgi:hypothetical protein
MQTVPWALKQEVPRQKVSYLGIELLCLELGGRFKTFYLYGKPNKYLKPIL